MGAGGSDASGCLETTCPVAAQNSAIARQKAAAAGRRRPAPGSAEAANEENEAEAGALGSLRAAGTKLLGRLGVLDSGEVAGAMTRPDEKEEAEKAAMFEKTKAAARHVDDDLHHGSMRGELKRVRRALDANASVASPNPRGVTPLMLASASSGKEAIEVLKELLNRKADMFARDNNGWGAFHHACRNGKTEISKFLISNGLDPAQMTSDHKSCLMLAVIEGKVELVKDLMKLKVVREQVVEKDALGTTALHYAVKDGSLEIAKLLVEYNAKVNAKDIDGKVPLMWACEYGKLDCVKQLAKKSADIDSKDKSSRTPLLFACLNSYEGVALWLVKKGADPYYRDVNGDSPLTVADDNGLTEFRRALKMRRMEQEDQE